ncbi:helix-turn-helix domain-containing protein [Nocardia cyriacigeorgica]|uniref:Anaerobic benzoate catabolism transcriptional regulator n=1 Tax=Nocardia cyriacigeorgica TaxID=135487 RepID=A0A4U8WIE4_9NOCA|nr:helix-turn-helix transcriptional regulator [Nocardia cyriacigeorgica]VFB01819.1 anaerobic benzoate catabolism transcriptional regulator [Nocardia cyriacigeorgica]
MSEHPRLHSIPGGREDRSAEPHPDAEPLWREVLGTRLRALRQQQQETLAETAGRAGVSPQYLSEIERGRKEPSSEMIAALAGALGTSLAELAGEVAETLGRRRALRPVGGSGYRRVGNEPAAPSTGATTTGGIVLLAA